jgi:hypothetical protein
VAFVNAESLQDALEDVEESWRVPAEQWKLLGTMPRGETPTHEQLCAWIEKVRGS